MVGIDPHINIKRIVDQFEIIGEFDHAEAIHVGHINDTILVRTKNEIDPDYVIQRINHTIFRDVDKLMENILRVTTHISGKLKSDNKLKKKSYVELVKSIGGKYYYLDNSGNYWRCYVYCRNGSEEHEGVSPMMAFEGGRALGKFQQFLADLPGGPLYETIPGFHNLEKRLMDFHKALNADAFGRAKYAVDETDFFISRADEMIGVYNLIREGAFPLRVTHNDTKFNNILFDENANALCIIDLDTVMNGYIIYDFGDAIRTLTNTISEDDPEIDQVNFDFELYNEFSKGYLLEINELLTKNEIENLAFSAKYMTYMIAMRFLTDYLKGDIYYKTDRDDHNLHRTQNQLALLKKMDENFEGMVEVIRKYAKA